MIGSRPKYDRPRGAENSDKELLLEWFRDHRRRPSNWDFDHKQEILARFEDLMEIGITMQEYGALRRGYVRFDEFDYITAKHPPTKYE